MVHYKLRNNAQADGAFTDLFILGEKRKFNATTKVWGSDFTGVADAGQTDATAGTTCIYNLIQVTETTPAAGATQAAVPRYVVGYPLAMLVVKYPFSNTSDNPKLDLGVTTTLAASTSLLAGTATDLELQDRVVLPLGTALPLATNTVSLYLTATITNVTNTVSTLVGKTGNPADTGVDLWIYVCLLPYRDWVLNRVG